MSLLEMVCKELGVKIGETWLGTDGFCYRITNSGEIEILNTDGELLHCSYVCLGAILRGELKPAWTPKHGATYYMPDILIKDLYIAERWENLGKDYMFLNRGLVFGTKEEAVAMAKRMMEFIEEER